jgi:hypothetical protein
MVDAFARDCKRLDYDPRPDPDARSLLDSGHVRHSRFRLSMFEIAKEEEYPEIADEFVRACRESSGRGGMSGRKPTFLLLQNSSVSWL